MRNAHQKRARHAPLPPCVLLSLWMKLPLAVLPVVLSRGRVKRLPEGGNASRTGPGAALLRSAAHLRGAAHANAWRPLAISKRLGHSTIQSQWTATRACCPHWKSELIARSAAAFARSYGRLAAERRLKVPAVAALQAPRPPVQWEWLTPAKKWSPQ